jgi:hypothetical protein
VITLQRLEVASAGEVYFSPAGHVLIYPGPAKVLELNPAFALQQCMDAMQRAANKAAVTTEHDRSVMRGYSEGGQGVRDSLRGNTLAYLRCASRSLRT